MAEKRFAKLGLTVVYKAYKIDREGYTKEGKYYGHSSSQPNTVYEWSIQREDPWEELAYGTDRATSVSALMTKIKSNHKSAFRQGNPTVSVSSLPIGTWQPAHAIRQNADGSVDILREKNSGRRANISEGFMDANGHFHPIRSASDYSNRAAGEKRQYAPAKKRRSSPLKGRAYAGGVSRKKASSKPAMVTSRREYGGDGSRYRNPGSIKIKFTVRDRIGKPTKAPHTRNFADWVDVKDYGQKLANTKGQNVDWKETTGPSFLRRSGTFYAK